MGNRSSSVAKSRSRDKHMTQLGQTETTLADNQAFVSPDMNSTSLEIMRSKKITNSMPRLSLAKVMKNSCVFKQEEPIEDEGIVFNKLSETKCMNRSRHKLSQTAKWNHKNSQSGAFDITKVRNQSPIKGKAYEIKFTKNGDNDKIHLEGILEKYHPGFSMMYVPRECKIKPTYFEYYSSSIQYLKVPLRRIFIKDIESVSKVQVETASPTRIRRPIRHQFEIIMKPTWRPKKTLFEEKDDLKIDEEKSSSIIQRPNSTVGLRASDRHLMPKPQMLEKYKESIKDSPRKKQKKKVEGIWNVNGVSFGTKKEAEEYRKYIYGNKIRLSTLKNEEKIEVKNPKKWIDSLAGNHTWNNRELEWYLSEQRMLFSAKSKDECNRWIFLLNWLMEHR